MAPIRVQVINQSTVLADADVEVAVPALQKQVHEHFAPYWTDADLAFAPRDEKPDPTAWWLVVLDDSDQAGALGYHDLTSTGLPLGKVFADSDIKDGLSWTVTASHELLEMLADPYIDLSVFVQADAGAGVIYAYEVCDACESDDYAYDIDGTKVSDFVLPSWFQSQSKMQRFDYAGRIDKPLELLAGGYIGTYDVSRGHGWNQVLGPDTKPTYAMRPRVGSRRERRRTPKSQWLDSDVETSG